MQSYLMNQSLFLIYTMNPLFGPLGKCPGKIFLDAKMSSVHGHPSQPYMPTLPMSSSRPSVGMHRRMFLTEVAFGPRSWLDRGASEFHLLTIRPQTGQ
jgi:hypothetical protein